MVNMMTRDPARLRLTRTAMMTRLSHPSNPRLTRLSHLSLHTQPASPMPTTMVMPRDPARLKMKMTWTAMTTHPMLLMETNMMTANSSQETARLRMLLKPLPSPERTPAVPPKLDSPWLYSGLSSGTTSPQL